MDLAVYVKTPVRGNGFSSENLVSEARWERLVFESLLSSNKVEHVYSVLPIWKTNYPKPNKFIDGPIGNKINNFIIVAPNDWPLEIKLAKGLIVNSYYCKLFTNLEFCNFRRNIKDNFFLFHPFEGFRDRVLNNPIEINLFLEDFFLPRIPYIQYNNNRFNNKILIFPHKSSWTELKKDDNEPLCNWIAIQLDKNKDLQFHIITGMEDSSLLFYNIGLNVYDYFFNSKSTNILKKFRDRIIIHKALDWSNVLSLFSRSKISIAINKYGSYVSGAALESGMFGVPFIYVTDAGMSTIWYEKLKPYSAKWCSKEYFDLMDRLMVDEIFYNEVSIIIQEYVKRYTYESFNKNLFAAIEKRSML